MQQSSEPQISTTTANLRFRSDLVSYNPHGQCPFTGSIFWEIKFEDFAFEKENQYFSISGDTVISYDVDIDDTRGFISTIIVPQGTSIFTR